MSTLAFSSDPVLVRRHGGRRLQHAQVAPVLTSAAVVAVPARVDISATPAGPDSRPLLVAVAILAAHLGAAWYWHGHPVRADAVTPPTPPITVELYKAPIEPPKPLPQKKEPPPPPVVTHEQPRPAVKLPDPPPAPVNAEPTASSVPVAEAPPAPVAPPPVAAKTPEEPLTQPSASAAYLRNPAPAYPDFAQEQGWEGRVVLKVLVSADGKASRVQVKRASGYKVLDESALQAVQRWSFVPARRGSTPVEGWVDVPIDFRLSS